MYRIIVLNETGCESYSREYNTFISALCLARMGHEVLYIGNTRFAQEFYQGGHQADVDIFDMQAPETPAMLPVGFDMFQVPQMDSGMINDQRLGERIRSFGRTDLMFFSGNEYMTTFAEQVGESKGATVCTLDWANMPPCVNEIQLERAKPGLDLVVNRIVSIAEYMWMPEDIARIRNICKSMDDYELWIIAAIPQRMDVTQDYLHKQKIYWQPPLSDSGRFTVLKAAGIYVDASENPNKQGIAEALCVGVPVIGQTGETLMKTFGAMLYHFPQCETIEDWFKPSRKERSKLTGKVGRKLYGFAARISFLHDLIVGLEC